MAAVPSGDVDLTRYPHSRIKRRYLYAVELVPFATGKINGTPVWPQQDFATDNESASWEDVRIGQLVRVTDPSTGALKYQAAARRAFEAGLMKINLQQEGDPGYGIEAYNSIADNDDVTVYDVVVPWTTLSRLDDDTGEVLKRGDVAYTDQTITPQPVVNLGVAFEADTVGGTAQFTLTIDNCFSWVGGTLSVVWELPSGVTLEGGYNLTDDTIVVNADPGQYRVLVVVSDSNAPGNDKAASVWLFANDHDTYLSFGETYQVAEMPQHAIDEVGWKATFVITGDVDSMPTVNDYLYTGAPVLFTYEYEFSADGITWESLSENGVKKFIGFIRRYSDVTVASDNTASITIEVESALHYAAAFPLASQALIEDAAPDAWTEVDVDLNNVAFMLYYILNEHSRHLMLGLLDFYNLDDFDDFRRSAYGVNATTVLEALRQVTAYITGANVGVTSDGRMLLQRNLSLENSTYRSGKANRFTFTSADIHGVDVATWQYTRDLLMPVSQVESGGFIWASGGNTTAVRSQYPLLAPAIGTTARENPRDFIALDETDVYTRVGNWFAYLNRPTPTLPPFEVVFDLIEPPAFEPCLLSMSALDALGSGITTRQILPRKVNYAWENWADNGQPPRIYIEAETVSQGYPGQQVIQPPRGAQYDPAVIAACATLNITWASTGATPSGWSGLSGQTPFNPNTMPGLSPGFNTFAGSRSSMANWTSPSFPEVLGVMYEFPAACTLNHMEATFTWSSGSNGKNIVFMGLVNGAWTALDYRFYAAGTANTGATFSTTPGIVVSAVIFACNHGSSAATINMTVSKINSP